MTPLAQLQALRESGEDETHAEMAARAARARWQGQQEERRAIRWALQGYDEGDPADRAEMERWG